MILVTGATGTIGGQVTAMLRDAGEPVRTASRAPGQDVVVDFADPGSLRAAFAGVKAVLLLTAYGSHLAAQDPAMIEAAQAAGVGLAVKVSAIGLDLMGDKHPHLVGERALRESGMDWTILRPAGFASNARRWLPQLRAGSPVPNMTGGGAEPVIDPRDVAAVAVAALAGGHEGLVCTPTGPELLSVPDRVAVLGRVLGRELEVVDVDPEVAARGLPDPVLAETALTGMRLVRDGYVAEPTDDVRRLLGRSPGTFEGWVRDHLSEFSAG